MTQTLAAALFAILIPAAYADQGSITNTGGTVNPPGILTIGGTSLTYFSTDGTIAINTTITTSSSSESCSGGGKGGHVTCYTTFTASFSGTLSVSGGATQAINGSTYQSGVAGGTQSGTTSYNSAYTPFYYSDSEQILRADDLQGTNQITYGSQGSGSGQFYGAYGIAVDSYGRIYVADTYNCRVVRIDDMNGTNWTTFGTCGSGPGQFYDPSGIAVDSNGKIYVMDTGNSRLIRMDDMTGANWISFGIVGSGVGQFASFVSVAVDAINRIYVADGGNKRIVRMDDITGLNWTVLTQSPPMGIYIYSFYSPVAVAVDPGGRIYVVDAAYYAPEVVRVDDMMGTNWTSLYVSPSGSGAPNSVSIDSTGIVFTGGGGVKIIDGMSGVQNSSGAIAPYGSYYVFGVTPVRLPSPRPSAIRLSPATLNFSQNVGTSASLPVTITNFGGSLLRINSITAKGGFTETDNCAGQALAGGSSCTVTVMFAPSATGPFSGSLTVNDDSFNAGAVQTVPLNGTGTAPVASVTPARVSFSSQVLGTISTARSVVLQDTGTGPMQVASVTVTGPFSQTNNCGSVAPTAYCTIQVSFTPNVLGAASGILTITDNAGTQTVTLTGNGSAPVTFSPSSLNLGSVAVGNTGAASTVTVTNRSNTALAFSSVAITGNFAIASNTCVTSITAGATCTVGVTFTPTAISSFTGTLTFTDSAFTSPQVVNLSGTGSAPVTLSASSESFGTVAVGNTSSVKAVTLTNRQNIPLNFTSVGISGNFAIAGNTCVGSLAAGANCTVGMTFTPTAISSFAGTLTFTNDAGNSPQAATLSGTGSAPLTFSSSTLNFGTVTIGTTSSAKTVTVTNRQSVSLSFSSIVASAGFAMSSNTCGASIAAGANCTVGVKFSPAATGTVNGALTFTDSAATSPQTMNLRGTGQ